MTNRDYLRGLDNEELANAIGRCHMACEETKCESIDCQKCCLKWLEKERGSDVKKWQMRRDPYDGCFWLILYVSEENGIHNWCLGLNEHGNVARLSVDIVRAWVLWDEEKEKNDDDVNKFLERLLNDLIEKD